MSKSMPVEGMVGPPSPQHHSAAGVTPSYRRNGKLFSCEPCRRGKLRCDHNSPVCGRCARRNKPEQCIYHPAPLTKPRSSCGSFQQRTPTPSSRGSNAVNALSDLSATPRDLASPRSNEDTTTAPNDFPAFRAVNVDGAPLDLPAKLRSPPVLAMDTPVSGEEIRTSSSASYASPETGPMSYRDSKLGFLGPTSYSAVFAENPGSLSIISEPADTEESADLPPITADKIQEGADVLAMLRDMPIYERFTQRWFDLCEGILIHQPIFRIWIDELWSEFGRLLTECKPDQLRSLSELVWRNTRKPIKVHSQMSGREWAKAASGRNLRWETVGMILALVGLIAANLSNWDSIFDSIREKFIDRAAFADRMRKASGYCLCFCYESEVLNENYVCFMYQDLILVESMKGEAHYAAWQRTGEVCDAIVAMGLHQGNRVDAETPFFLAELRKKIFISAYGRDKVVASFLGRPPRLSYRYCKMEMPLDLSDDQLFLEGADLDAVLATLDSNGWNTSGNMNRTTWSRVWFQHCRIREDILEIALGSGEEDITLQAEKIRLKLDRLHETYPDFMKVPPEEVLNKSEGTLSSGYVFGRQEIAVRQVTSIFTLCIHAGIVQTEFLLLRALINRQRSDTKELIPVSRRLLSLVLLGQSKRDFFRDFQGDLVWLMAIHGLPAAGVLAIELLKQEQSRMYSPEILPRSETIQDLSVFISSLASVGPGEGNYSICNQGRKALKKVLDQILSPSFTPVGEAGDLSLFHDMSFYLPMSNDADFLQWLENVEWDKAPPQGAS